MLKHRVRTIQCKSASHLGWPCRARKSVARTGVVHAADLQLKTSADPSKRTLLLALLTCLPPLLKPTEVNATILKSLESRKTSTLTFFNRRKRTVKIYWNNYDADKEFYATIPPLEQYTVDTWATHPWSIVDAETGLLVKEVVAVEGSQLVPIQESDESIASDQDDDQIGTSAANTFDGLGGSADKYASVQISEIKFDNDGAIVILKAIGFSEPLAIAIGPAEAYSIYRTFGPETRRPSTLTTWQQSLAAVGVEVERVILTRLVGSTYYSRLILRRAEQIASIDSRPSDSLALALQSGSPIFVSKELMRFNDEESILAREFLNEQILIPDITQGERGGRDPPGPMMPLVPEYEGAFDA